MKKSVFLLLALAAPCALALPGPTAASYAWGAQLTVAGYDAAKPVLTNFPVLVLIAENAPSGFSYAQVLSPDGADLCFIDPNGNGLPFEIDTWNTNGTSLVWVTLPTMEQGTEFVMCWGGATSGKSVCPDNPFAGYKGVWHMNATSPADASGNGNGGTAAGLPAVSSSGAIGSALSLPTTSDYVTCGTHQSNAELKDAFTVEAWVNPASYSGNRCFFGKDKFISIRTESQNKIQVTTPGKKDHPFDKLSLPDVGTWWHLVVTFQKTTSNGCKVYTNGVFAAQQYANDIDDKSNPTEMWFGKNQWGQNYTGLLDEMRLSAGIKSADWIAATYATQTDPAFLTAGAATPYEATPTPQVVVGVSDVQYTNATLTVSIGSLGQDDTMTADASWVDATLLVATDDSFADPLFALPLARTNEAPVSFSVAVQPLATNATYYARILATNSFGVAGESGAAAFATRAPGAPAGAAAFDGRGFTTLAVTGAATDFGTGGESAAIRLEASTNGFETVAAFSPEVVATIGASETFTVSGLSPDTTYALRLRITNDWGVATTVALPDAATRAVPFATTGLGWTFSQDGSTVDVTFGVSDVYDGATGSATLCFGEAANPTASQGACVFGAATNLSWRALPVTADPMHARVILSATLAGRTYTQTFDAPITRGSTAVAVSDIEDHASAETAVRVHAGDVVTLPALSGSARYILGNKLFGSLDGNVLTALRPGILGIHCVDNESNTNTLAVLVLPEKIGNGDIYVFKDASVGNNWCNWNDPSKWEKLGSETNDSWPRNPDDIAIVAYYRNTGVQFDPRDGGCTMGALYAGGYRDAKAGVTIRCVTKQNDVTLTSPVVFERTDGGPARIQLCPNSPLAGDNDFRAKLAVQDNVPSLAFRSDTIISGGSDRADSSYPQGRFAFDAKLFDIDAGATVSLVEMDTWETGAAVATMGGGRLTGAGTFWNRSAAAIRFARNKTTFTGLLRDSGGHGHQQADRVGPTEIRSNSTNCTAETVGWVSVNASSQPNTWWKTGVGCIVVGHDHGHNAPSAHPGTNWFPRVATLHGGWLQLLPHQVVWGEPGVLDRKYAQRLVAADGFSYVRAYSRDTSGGWPVNWFEADELGHENKATLRIDDDSRRNTALKADQAIFLRGWASAAVGPAGDPESSDACPIVPWIVSPLDNGNTKLYFATFDSAARLVRPAVAANNTPLSNFSAGRNAFCRNAGVALANDLTVNSLYLQNDTKGKTLGAGRTLTVTSGGLILSDVDDNNNPGAAAIGEEGGSENGFLVLGDADHPAYVWASGATTSSANTAPNQIWAPVTAPGGFVAAYTGHLVLGGDQTGIGEELVVNAGTLTLGSADRACTLARNLPIRIYANATLRLPNETSTAGKLLQFDGAAGWFGKVEIADGVAAKCKKAYVRDYPDSPEWETLPRGVYGSSGSSATGEFVRNDLFSGAGTLEVVSDDRIRPALMILR